MFHAAREKANKKCHISSLRIQDKIVSEVDLIEKEVTCFFSALFNGYHDTNLKITDSPFKPDNTKLDEFLQHLSRMSPQEAADLDEDLDIEDLDIVIKECVNNKAPGIDGISYEFYKKNVANH